MIPQTAPDKTALFNPFNGHYSSACLTICSLIMFKAFRARLDWELSNEEPPFNCL
jgi:hypothetical protein